MLSAAQEVASHNGHLLFVVNLGHVVGADLQRDAIDTLLQHQVTGLVFACMYHQEVEPPLSLPDGTVFVNCRAKRVPFRSIIPAEQSAAAAAVRLLLDTGHRRIGFLDDPTHPRGTPAQAGRLPRRIARVQRRTRPASASAQPGHRRWGCGGGCPAGPAAGRQADRDLLLQRPHGDGVYRAARHRG